MWRLLRSGALLNSGLPGRDALAPHPTLATSLTGERGSRRSPLPLITNARLFQRNGPAGFSSSLGINENPTTSSRHPQTMQRHGVPHALQGTVGHSEPHVPWRPKSKFLACHLMDTWRKTPWWARSQCPRPADYHSPPGESRQRDGNSEELQINVTKLKRTHEEDSGIIFPPFN